MNRALRLIPIVVSLLAVAVAWPAGDVLFRASFEKGFDADESGGKAAPWENSRTAIVPDRFGKSLVLNPGGGAASYTPAGNIDLQQGTAVLWVQPNGLATATQPVTLLSAAHEGGWLGLYWDPREKSLVGDAWRNGQLLVARKPAYDWGESTWHHVVLSWSPESLTLYVDGQAAAGKATAGGKDSPLESLILGGNFGGTASLSYRALTILKTALTADQVQEKYRVAMSGQVQHERPLLTVGQCAKPPTVDGKVEDAEWAAAGGAAGLVEIASGQLSAAQTRFLVTYDATNVYLAFICPIKEKPFAHKFDRDTGTPWDEDAIEAWLQPEVGFTATCYHIIVNAAGSLYDMQDQNAGWNGTSAWAATQDDTQWMAEIAIPHSALGTMAPTPGTKWQANFCRSFGNGATTNRHTAWAFTNGSGYGVWQMFGALAFQPQSPVARVTGWTAGGSQSEVKLQLANPTAQPAPVAANVTVFRLGNGEDTQDTTVGPWTLAPGEVRTETVAAKADFGADQVKLQVRSGEKPLLVQMVRAGSKEAVSGTAVAAGGPSGTSGPTQPKLTQAILDATLAERKLWEHNTIGITSKVLPPWTPMTLAGKLVGCWGRKMDYTASLFPRQFTAQGADLLAGPVALVAKIAGREVVLQKADQQSVTAAPNEVNFDAKTTAGNLTARVQSHLEYDGCIKLTVILSSKGQPVPFDSLELRVPLKPERALYYHWFEATRDPRLTNAGAIPAAGLKGHFKPFLWLGDDDRGLCWFAEKPQGWQINDKESVLNVERGAGQTVMRIRMVDRPWKLDGQWQTVFGLMATPSRPTPKGWRDWLIPLNQTNPWGTWAPGFNNLSGTDDPGTLMPKDPAAMKLWVENVQKNGEPCPYYPTQEPCQAIPYSQVVFWSGKYRDGMPAPEIKLFGPEWGNVTRPPGPRQEPDDQIPLKEYYWVCPNSSFSQYYIYRLNQLLDQVPINGIYIDGSWWFCSNKQHGCGYADDQGQWQMQYNIWAFRELFKRMYALFYERRQNPVLHFHTSCWLAAPCLSWCHMMLDGEQYHDAGQKVEDHFMDIVPMDKWRAEHSSHFGPAPFILPDIPGQWAQAQAPTRELLMLTNLHDVGIFPGSFNTRLMMRDYQARRMFGVADCQFKGYWKTDWVTCPTSDGHVSIYRKPDGSKCLLVVGNSAKQDNTLTVKPNLAALKLKGAITASVDLETGEKIALANGVLAVPVKARDYRLIALPYYAPPPITAGDLRASALKTVKNGGFENDLDGWYTSALEGNTGTVTIDTQTKYAGRASAHLFKADGPGGVHLETAYDLAVTAGVQYRVSCQLKIANSTGAQAYWMISATDNEGNSVLSNNLFAGFVKENQDWRPLPYEFTAPPGAVAIRIHFLVAFPGKMDAWVDDITFEEVK